MPSPASLLKAKALSRSVLRSALDAEATVAANKEAKAQEAKGERERLSNFAQVRIQEHLQMVRCDEDRIAGSDEAIKQASACLRALQHARYAHFAAMQVCERRLELREDRPPKVGGHSAAPRDAPQEALEAQRDGLTGARQSLLQLEERARQLLKELEGVRGLLSRDAAQRRLAVEQDRGWIISLGLISVAATSSSLPPPPAQPEGIDAEESRRLADYVQELEVRVRQLKARAAAEMQQWREECGRAGARVEELLMRSVYSLDDVGRRLKEQAKEVDGTIRHAERSMYETKKNLIKNDRIGSSKVEALEALIKDLRATRHELQEDINTKGIMLNIDERCRKVTPAMASEQRPGAGAPATPLSAAGSTLAATGLMLAGGGPQLGRTASGAWLATRPTAALAAISEANG